jgi:hypothetical protein
MNATVENVMTEALSPPLSSKWREEIRRRCAELDCGAVELRHAENVFAEAFAAFV